MDNRTAMRLCPSCFKKCARSAQPHNKTPFIAPLLLVPGFFPGAFSFALDTDPGAWQDLRPLSVSLYHEAWTLTRERPGTDSRRPMIAPRGRLFPGQFGPIPIPLDKRRVWRTTYNGPPTRLLPFQGLSKGMKSFPHIVVYPRHFYFSYTPILGGQRNTRKAIAAARILLTLCHPMQ